jgi:hypothetical protein
LKSHLKTERLEDMDNAEKEKKIHEIIKEKYGYRVGVPEEEREFGAEFIGNFIFNTGGVDK